MKKNLSLTERLLSGETIESIEATENIVAIETTTENEFLPTPPQTVEVSAPYSEAIEMEDETESEDTNAKVLSFKDGERQARSGTQKATLYGAFDNYQEKGIASENWLEKAKSEFPEILEQRIVKTIRTYKNGEYVRNGETLSRKVLSVAEAMENFEKTEKEALKTMEIEIHLAKVKFCNSVEKARLAVERSKENEKVLADKLAKEAKESIAKANKVMQTLSNLDTSKVEVTPEMREMMLKLLGMQSA